MVTVLENQKDDVLEVHMESDTCPQCGAPIPAGTLEAHLPDCPGQVIIREVVKRVPTKFPKYPEPDNNYVSPWTLRERYRPKYTTSLGVRRGDKHTASSSSRKNHRMC